MKEKEFFTMQVDLDSTDQQQVLAEPAGSFDWQQHGQEGQLAVDVLQTSAEIIIVTTIAGAAEGTLDVFVQHDIVTIRGTRRHPLSQESYSIVHQECFWGDFSRTIVLPVDVLASKAEAQYKQGILTVRIPTEQLQKKVKIRIVED